MKREKLQIELNKVSNELEKVKTDRRRIKELSMSTNTNLLKRLNEEVESKLFLVNEILQENSQFNKMSPESKVDWLNKIKATSVIE